MHARRAGWRRRLGTMGPLLAVCATALGAPPAWAGDSGAACAPARPHPAGRHEIALEGRGEDARRYVLYVPTRHDGRTPVPVVVDLHGTGATPKLELAISGLDRAAERHGFAVALPVGGATLPDGRITWNVPPRPGAPDDVAFVARVLDDVAERLCADTSRVWVMGFSGGARMGSQLACALPARVAAVSAVAGVRHPRGAEGACAAGGRVPVLAIHGGADPLNAWHADATSPPWWTYGVDEAMRRWAAHHGCAATPQRERLAPGATRVRWPGCTGGAALELVRVDAGGHTWPGTRFVFPPALQLGPTSRAVDATALSLQFFARFGLPLDAGAPTPSGGSQGLARDGSAGP